MRALQRAGHDPPQRTFLITRGCLFLSAASNASLFLNASKDFSSPLLINLIKHKITGPYQSAAPVSGHYPGNLPERIRVRYSLGSLSSVAKKQVRVNR